MHRARLLRHVVARSLDPRRNQAHSPALLSWQGVLGEGAVDRLLSAILIVTPQSSFTVVAPLATGHELALRELLDTMNSAPGVIDPSNSVVRFGEFERLHFARLVVLDDTTLADLEAHGLPRTRVPTYVAFLGDCDGPWRALLAD